MNTKDYQSTNIGVILKHFREKNTLSIKQVEQNTSISNLNRLENGKFSLDTVKDIVEIKELCELYNINFKKLIELNG